MKKKKLTMTQIRNGKELLPFSMYCSFEKKALVNVVEAEDKLLRLTDFVSYYKSNRYACFKQSSLMSKLDLINNPDLENESN